MGGGSAPGPQAGLSDPSAIDDGTLPRIGSPTPGAIGLGGKGGAGRRPRARRSAQSVVSFALHNLGQPVGDGECFTLADRALRNAGAKSAADYGPVVPDGDYVWGTPVSLSSLRPGDIVQFRDYSCRVETEIESSTETRDRRARRGAPAPHRHRRAGRSGRRGHGAGAEHPAGGAGRADVAALPEHASPRPPAGRRRSRFVARSGCTRRRRADELWNWPTRIPITASLTVSEMPGFGRRVALAFAKATFNIADGKAELETQAPQELLLADTPTPLGDLPRDDLPRGDSVFEVVLLGQAHAPGRPAVPAACACRWRSAARGANCWSAGIGGGCRLARRDPGRARAVHRDAADLGARLWRHHRRRDRPRVVRRSLRRAQSGRPRLGPGTGRRGAVPAPEVARGLPALRPGAPAPERGASGQLP